MLPRVGPALLVLGLAAGLVGCGDSTGEGGSTAAAWPSAGASLDSSGLVYAIGDVVHLGDGSTISVGREIEHFVIGGGIYFSTDEIGPDAGRYLGARPLYYSDGSGESSKLADSVANLRSSPDGRYLGFVDTSSGEQDEFGTALAQVVVVDLETGDEVARTSKALGEPGSDDLADLYEDAEPGALVLTDETAYYAGVGEVVAIDLATGDVGVDQHPEDDLFRLRVAAVGRPARRPRGRVHAARASALRRRVPAAPPWSPH